MDKLAKVEVVMPPQVARILDDLLILDARCIDDETARELLRLMPRLARIRSMWRTHYRKYGCLACPKPDSTILIAARLKRGRVAWEDIYRIIGVDYAATTLKERKSFKKLICRTIPRLDKAPRYHLNSDSHERDEVPERRKVRVRSHTSHYAGGFCDKCYRRVRRRLSKIRRQMDEGRDIKKDIAALSQRYDVAQWLLNSDEDGQNLIPRAAIQQLTSQDMVEVWPKKSTGDRTLRPANARSATQREVRDGEQE